MERAKTRRKPYSPPEMRKVNLAVDEAVLRACKTPSNEPARRTGNRVRVCGIAACRDIGS